jgi:serine/threonine-protein kinase
LSAIGDARLELDETEAPAGIPAAPASRTSRTIGLGVAAGLAAVAVLATVGVMYLLTPSAAVLPAAAGPLHVSLALPHGDEVTDKNLLPLDISPDGTRVAYVGLRDDVRRLFLRNLADKDPVSLAGTEGARSPFFSPDGQWIGFFAQGKLKKVAVGSGAIQVVADDVPDPRGGTWSTDGTIYYTPTNTAGIWKVSASGGVSSEVTRLDRTRGEISHRWPQAVTDGVLLFSQWTGPGPDERAIVALTLATGARHVLVASGDTPRYVAAGYLAYGRLDTLLAVPWRPSQTQVADVAPISLAEFPRLENEGAANYAVSTTGTLAYVAGGAARYAQRVVWVDRTGATEALPMPERDYEAVTLSPDGQRAVVQIRDGAMGLWVFDFSRRTLTPLVTSGGSSQAPVWTRDSARIVYRGTRQGSRNLYWTSADGSGQEDRLTTNPDVLQTPSSVSPDGEWLVFNEGGGQHLGTTVWAMRLRGDRTPRLLAQGVSNGQVSPDGRWMAYQSNASGQFEIFATSFPGPGPRIPVSVNGGIDPLWSGDGRELFYTRGEMTMAVTVAPGGTLSVSAPRALFGGRYRPASNSVTPFAVTADSRRFLRIQQAQADRPMTRIDVVLNWFSELTPPAAK